jgi:hypothetical protein
MKSNYLIEEYYQKINPELNLVSSYLEDKSIKDIFIKCRLKPYKYNAQFNRKLILREHWVDEFNNSLFLDGKKIKIIENDLTLEPDIIKNTDMYYELSIDKTYKISNMMHLIYGKDEDYGEDYFTITLLGIDNYLRTFCMYNYQWYRFSPLSLNINNLKKIINNQDIKLFKKINDKEDVIFPCHKKEEWLVSLPIHQSFWNTTQLTKEKLYFLGAL